MIDLSKSLLKRKNASDYENLYSKVLFKVPFRRSFYLFGNRILPTYNFIHINKCGGTTVEKSLGIPKIHDSALQRQIKIGSASWAKSYNFTIIREPLDRLYSFYRYRLKQNYSNIRGNNINFDNWLSSILFKSGEIYDGQIKDTNPLMFAPMKHWISDKRGRILVDDIFLLENLCENWPQVQRQINCNKSLRIRNINTRVPKPVDIRAYDLLTQATKDKFLTEFSCDIEMYELIKLDEI